MGSTEPLLQVSALPTPPMAFVALYSDENLEAGRAPSPPPVLFGAYESFGEVHNTEDEDFVVPLEEHGIKRLHPMPFSRRLELKKLNISVLTNFLDLLDIMVKCPEDDLRLEKIDDISLIFIHLHHLINEFRPFQAREATRALLDVQRRKRIELIRSLDDTISEVCNSVEAISLTPSLEHCDDCAEDGTPSPEHEASCDQSSLCDDRGEGSWPALGGTCCFVKDFMMCRWVDGLVELELFASLKT